jgi:hypothetical protein
MAERLAERFQAARGAPIELDGRLVHMLHELPPLTAPARLRIGLRTSAPRPQGLRLRARGGELVVGGRALDDVVLWSDTAPPEVVLGLRPAGTLTVRLWNVWRDGAGTMQAWIGDAGMLVEDGRLRCSDGFDRPSFGDLEVALALEMEPYSGRR